MALTKPDDTANTLAAAAHAVNINLDTNLITMVNQTDFSYILKETGNRLLVVEFFAQWCGPCQSLTPKLEELANAYNGSILIVKVDVDAFEDLTLEHNITAIPTFMLMKNEKKLEQFTSSNAQTLEKNLEKHVGRPEVAEENRKI